MRQNIPAAEFEPIISESEWPQTYALDRAAAAPQKKKIINKRINSTVEMKTNLEDHTCICDLLYLPGITQEIQQKNCLGFQAITAINMRTSKYVLCSTYST